MLCLLIIHVTAGEKLSMVLFPYWVKLLRQFDKSGVPHSVSQLKCYACPDLTEEEMKQIPSGTELARPFMPAKNFDLSKSFYETLGFEKLLDGDVAIFRAGSGGFILQRHYQKEWAENFMMQLMVDDLDAWWTHIDGLDLPGKFNVQPPRAPAMQPWGLRVAYVFDPSGVLWHIAQRRDGAIQD